jgi:hypothetical protein
VILVGFMWGGRVALGEKILVEVGLFILTSVLLGLFDTAYSWRSINDM